MPHKSLKAMAKTMKNHVSLLEALRGVSMKIELQTSRQKLLSFIKRSITLLAHFGLAAILVLAPSMNVAQAQSQAVQLSVMPKLNNYYTIIQRRFLKPRA